MYQFFKFITLDSISQYGTLQYIMYNAFYIIYKSAGWESPRENNYFNLMCQIFSNNNFQQLSKLIKVKFISTT